MVHRKLSRITEGLLILTLYLTALAGCQTKSETVMAGGAGGAAVGAGTGAIVGSLIANGDVAASALLGGAIGAPVGIALALAYYSSEQAAANETELDIIRRNQNLLFEQERKLEILRRQVADERPQLNFPPEEDEEPFFGTSLGNPYR